jgi:hypothetical protein
VTTPTLADLPGLWRRRVLTAPGIEDRATTVYWFQGAHLFADLRIPAALPGTAGATCLADLGAEGLRSLAACEGFAGETAVTDGICRWTRRINLQGPERGADIGRLTWGEGRDILLEEGVGADYGEIWERVEAAAPRAQVYRGPGSQRAWLVWTDARFLLARADPAAMSGPPLAGALEAALAEDRDPAPLLDMEFAFGHWEGRSGVAQLSTLPWRVGMPIVLRPADEDAPLDAVRMLPDGALVPESWRPAA